ncbi:ECF RNA polymerase sigma factor SigK [Streptomyces litmocidini]|uniref:ECF RNA polymerase sigma factor SigK n=1 Tax=Streptomyces litmocidini TaxID=67318 RepID=UPI0037033FA6
MDAPPPDGRPRPSLRLLPTGGAAKVNHPIPFNGSRPADTDRDVLTDVMQRVARGDKQAFSALYDALAPLVFGIVLKVVRDRAQSEEVAQEVMIDLWRQAARYRPDAGAVTSWAATIAHRRAVDRVRSVQATSDREQAQAAREHTTAYDAVAEQVETRLESEQVRRCMRGLTELQRQAVTLAYYQGLTYREVAEALRTPLPTIKTRMRDGLIRLRDCMGVTT